MKPLFTDFVEVATTTRSVRKRLDFDRPVPAAIIHECLDIALQAPTGGHAEDWPWIVVSDEATRKKLGDVYLHNFNTYVREPMMRAGSDHELVKGRLGGTASGGKVGERTARMLEGAAYLAENIHRSPWMVIPCATRPNPERGGAGTSSALYGSVYPAVWSFQMALRSYGLGSVITSLHLHSEDEVAEILGIPPEATQVALLPVAYTIGTEFKVAARKSVSEVTFENAWGTSFTGGDRA